MSNLILSINTIKWVLICLTCYSTSSLAWRILKRGSLHTVFNLGWCFYFVLTCCIFPFLMLEYFSLFHDMILHNHSSNPGPCKALYLCRMALGQGIKVPFLNLVFRYTIVEFSHYGLGLHKSFSRTGMRHWSFRAIYFTGLLFYTGLSFANHYVKSYQGMEKIVKGRICLLLRFVLFLLKFDQKS